jgi:predicted transcriptional regulator
MKRYGGAKMKTKRFIVSIQPLEKSLHGFAQALGAARKGKQLPASSGLSFSDVETFRGFFSKKRMELLQAIKKESPKSVYQLAHLVDREYKNVYDDVQFFKELGLIQAENKVMSLKFDRLEIEVVV